MKTIHLTNLLLVIAFSTVNSVIAQPATWTYQGSLADLNGIVNGEFEMIFGLHDSESGGVAISTVTNQNVSINGGIFTTSLSFDEAFFDGTDHWLELKLKPAGEVSFISLSPRQPLHSVPYALHSRLTDKAVTAVNLMGGAIQDFSFLGTTTSDPVEIISGGERGFRIEPIFTLSPNIIGGFEENQVRVGFEGVTIGGGGGAPDFYSTEILPNIAIADYVTISGGLGNTNSGYAATISGGRDNQIESGSNYSLISGGHANSVGQDTQASTISGGNGNSIGNNAEHSSIGGGTDNSVTNSAFLSTISGGARNSIFGAVCTIGGGRGNIVEGGSSTIGGGSRNSIDQTFATIGGGIENTINLQDRNGSIGAATIGGGGQNLILQTDFVTIGGGFANAIRSPSVSSLSSYSTISGGSNNEINHARFVTIGGGGGNIALTNSDNSTISGGINNRVEFGAAGASIGGGKANAIRGGQKTENFSWESYATIAGGYNNLIDTNAAYAAILGGEDNTIQGAMVHNSASGFNPVSYSVIVGGGGNFITSNAYFSAIPGGRGNVARGKYSFAGGNRADALHDGSFVWADSSLVDFSDLHDLSVPFSSETTNEFAVRAIGGVRFVTAVDSSGNPTAGVSVSPGGTGWSIISDRNMKENIKTVDGESMLEKIASLPISTWNMKSQDPSIRHIGPMAQDFHKVFGLGADNRRINTINADGVALAAIQGLNKKLEEKEKEIRLMQETIEFLIIRLEALEKQ